MSCGVWIGWPLVVAAAAVVAMAMATAARVPGRYQGCVCCVWRARCCSSKVRDCGGTGGGCIG